MENNKTDLFAGINKLNEMVLDKAHRMLKDSIAEDKIRVQGLCRGEKPDHFTEEQWEYFKSVGEKLLKVL